MAAHTPGIHHVTAIAGDPQQNIDFYAGILGLRLVKLTVNFDDPTAYHLYYGDHTGHPGTIITFFSWPGARPGRRGWGQVGVTSFAVPPGSIDFWTDRLTERHVRLATATHEYREHFGERILGILDPDGLFLELVEHAPSEGWPFSGGGPIPQNYAIRGFHSVTLEEEGYASTEELLTQTLGFDNLEQEGQIFRFGTGSGQPGAFLDIRSAPNLRPGTIAVGTVHHVAWRTAGDVTQQEARAELADLGYNVTPVLDRQYFHSIYFPEPGGVLFEIATDAPGFTIDESLEELGSHLKLPPWLEVERPAIERTLPPVRLPGYPDPG